MTYQIDIFVVVTTEPSYRLIDPIHHEAARQAHLRPAVIGQPELRRVIVEIPESLLDRFTVGRAPELFLTKPRSADEAIAEAISIVVGRLPQKGLAPEVSIDDSWVPPAPNGPDRAEDPWTGYVSYPTGAAA
jgi:hypothetical protein